MTGRGGRVGVEHGKRGNSLHSLGRVCQSAWAKNGALVRVAGHQPLLLLLVSISSLEQSSQGQTLSWALPAPASFRSLCLSLTYSPPPPMLSASYTQLSLLLPSSPLVYFFLFCAASQPSPPPPLFLLSGSLSSLSCSLSLSLSVYLYLSLPSLPPTKSNRSPLCPQALRVAAGIYSSPPPNTRPAWQV